MAKHLHEATEAELVTELERRGQAVGAGIPGLPPFVVDLLKRWVGKFGGEKVLDVTAQTILDDKIPHGGGKTLPVGHVERLGECNSRGAHGTIAWTKEGDRQP